MASQMYGVSGKRRRPYSYVDQINTQRAYLPQMISQKATKKYQADLLAAQDRGYKQTERELGLKGRELGISQQQLELGKKRNLETVRANRASESLGAANLDYSKRLLDYKNRATEKEAGLGILSLAGNLANSNIFNGIGSGSGTNLGKIGGQPVTPLLKTGGFGALAGFGAGKAFGGGKTGKKLLFGAGAGLLSTFLSNGPSNFFNMGSGLLGGAIGGLFS